MLAPSIMPPIMKSPINCGAIAMLAGLIIVPVVSLLTPKPEEKFVEDIFTCYDRETVVRVKDSLGNE